MRVDQLMSCKLNEVCESSRGKASLFNLNSFFSECTHIGTNYTILISLTDSILIMHPSLNL